MTECYELTVYGKKSVVELRGINLQRSSTATYFVRINGRNEFVTQNQRDAIRYIVDLTE